MGEGSAIPVALILAVRNTLVALGFLADVDAVDRLLVILVELFVYRHYLGIVPLGVLSHTQLVLLLGALHG